MNKMNTTNILGEGILLGKHFKQASKRIIYGKKMKVITEVHKALRKENLDLQHSYQALFFEYIMCFYIENTK